MSDTTTAAYNIDTLIKVLQTLRAHSSTTSSTANVGGNGASPSISYAALAQLLQFPDITTLKHQGAEDYYNHPRIKWVSVEAVIGAGKSSLLAALMKRSMFDRLRIGVFQVEEPVDAWERSGMLPAFYKDTVGEAALFQNYVFATRIGKFSQAYHVALNYVLQNDNRCAVIITERSPETDRDVFAYLQHKSGAMSARQHSAYLEQHRAWKLAVNEVRPDLYVWLDTPVTEAQKRTVKRARPGENVPEAYAVTLQERHEALFSHGYYCGAPVVRIDGNTPFLSDIAALETIATEMNRRIAALFPPACAPPPKQPPPKQPPTSNGVVKCNGAADDVDQCVRVTLAEDQPPILTSGLDIGQINQINVTVVHIK